MKRNFSIIMIVLLGLAWYVTLSTWFGNEKKYNEMVAEAKRLEEKGLYLDAIAQYEEAKEVKGRTLELEDYIADDYLSMGDYKEYRRKLYAIIAEYGPVEVNLDKLYEFTANHFSEDSVIDLVREWYEKYPESEAVLKYYDKVKGKYVERACAYEKIGDFAGPYAVYMQNGKKGLIGLDGKAVVEAVYDEIEYDGKDEQSIPVKDGEDSFFINDKGYKTKMPEEAYESLGMVSQGRIVAKQGGKYGYLDKSFRQKTEFIFDQASGICEGVGAVKQEDKWALINRKGELLTEYVYDDVLLNHQGLCSVNKIIAVRQGNDCYLINTEGERIAEQGFDQMKAFESEGMCAVCMDGKWGYAGQDGSLKITCMYEDAKSFTNGYAAVRKDGLWGYIDENGQMAISPVFDDAGLMASDGVAPVCHGTTWTLIQLKIMD